MADLRRDEAVPKMGVPACIEEETRLRINDLHVTYGWVLEKFAK
jgi:hypothetical protein